MAVISFKCPNCDGELIFDPATQKYKCEYCASLFSQEELDAMKPAESAETSADETEEPKEAQSQPTESQGAEKQEADNQSGSKEEPNEEQAEHGEAVTYTCPSCGAQIVTDATTAATFCYYCHNPVVLSGRLEGKFLPNKVVPFSVTREEAEKGFADYINKKRFVPKAFYSKKQIESMTGVYFPYWVYDVELEGKMQGDARDIRVWRTGDIEYTETKHYQVTREGEVDLNYLTENALKKANAKLANGLLPYRFDEMKSFQMGYLSGFLAERRDIERMDIENEMQSQMRGYAERLMRETISGYNSVTVQNAYFAPKEENWSYVLFPVWTLTYKAKSGRVYYYSMNGQTGKVCGELPINYIKTAAVSALVSAVVLVAGMIGGFLL